MGEFSKLIGQVGEDAVGKFLALIGWTSTRNNFDIASSDPEKHGKQTCGIDKYFHYKSPMISNTLEHVIISSKYSTNKYPNSPGALFKDYYYDLTKAIESFRTSSENGEISSLHSNISNSFYRGVLFWLHNDETADPRIINKIAKTELDKDWLHDGVFVVDVAAISFLYDSVNYPLRKYGKAVNQEFIYFPTGLNSEYGTKYTKSVF